jgi:hypothetical protein
LDYLERIALMHFFTGICLNRDFGSGRSIAAWLSRVTVLWGWGREQNRSLLHNFGTRRKVAVSVSLEDFG